MRTTTSWKVLWGVMTLAAAMSCAAEPPAEEHGAARLAITNAPEDATCLRVNAVGGRTVTRTFGLTPGQNTVFQLNQLPVGAVTFNADAFAVTCASLTGTEVARWISDPVVVNILPGQVANVMLLLKRNGRANVSVDFEPDVDAAPPAPDAAPPTPDAPPPTPDLATPEPDAAPTTPDMPVAMPDVPVASPDMPAGPAPLVFEARITSSDDDAEENLAGGLMDITSSDLEITKDGAKEQVLGLRFRNVTVPRGAVITKAYVQFAVDELTNSAMADVNIQGEASDNAAVYTSALGNISSRPRTPATALWSGIPSWDPVGEEGPDEQTPDLAPLIQAIVDRACWTSGNALALVLSANGAHDIRVAIASNHGTLAAQAPKLRIEYQPGTGGSGTCVTPDAGVVDAAPDVPPPPPPPPPIDAAPGNSTQATYLVPSGGVVAGVTFKALLTVGDPAASGTSPGGGPYRMVGIPDGLGAYDNGNGTFTLLMNHEIGVGGGITRAHGANGAFVSKWTINKTTHLVEKGEDLTQNVVTWNRATDSFAAAATGVAMGRFCSADLPDLSAVWNSTTGNGYDGRIFFNGEETGVDGRAFAHVVTGPEAGTTYEIPRMARSSWENVVLNPSTGDTTIAVGTDDSGNGQIVVYKGTKTNAGNAIEKAGLHNGKSYGLRVIQNAAALPTDAGLSEKYFASEGLIGVTSATFDLYELPDPAMMDTLTGMTAVTVGQQIEDLFTANVATRFARPEDGGWDPSNPNDFYFVTTDTGRLWRVRFNDVNNPTLGGTISIVVNTAAGMVTPDNMVVSPRGEILIQEDPGGTSRSAKTWRHLISTGTTVEIAQHDPQRFTSSGNNYIGTENEEASGVIDLTTILGAGWYAVDVQAHTSAGVTELVEKGQLLLMFVPPAP